MAMILDAFVGIFVEKMKVLIADKVVMMLGVKDDLGRLQRKMMRIQKFLEAAETRRLEDPTVEQWVAELKDVVYDADDIIDLCRSHGARLLADQALPPSSRGPVRFNFSIFTRFSSIPHRYQVGEKIRDLNDKLEEIYKDRVQFKFECGTIQREHMVTTVNTRQTSSMTEFGVVGGEIEESTNNLVKLIVQEQGNRCRLFAITGMGGIGKTTLAQKVFNNRKIQKEFQVKIWVCISQTYSEIDVLQQMIRQSGGNHGEARTKSELEPLLQSLLSGKSIFLVLDDVWRADLWRSFLCNLLQSADAIIRIVVTTRDGIVASQMGALHTHRVAPLSNETGWALLCRKVFGEENQEEEIRDFSDIGLEIVKRCRGLPLAIKAIAGVLAKDGSNRDEWEKVLKSKAWFIRKLPEDFRGALYLSYDDLSSPLKQCFLYCSLFPEYTKIERSNLIGLWIAEGFVVEEKDCFMEETAEEYYTELLRRNLLQPDPSTNDNSTCTMHDVMRSLAMFLSKDETLTPYTPTSSSSTKLRRLAVDTGESFSNLAGLLAEQKCLRSLLFFGHFSSASNMSQFDYQLTRFEHLRILQIGRMQSTSLRRECCLRSTLAANRPQIQFSSVGVLVNLRCLNINSSYIRELPESIGRLINLQFLNFENYVLQKLPNSIMQLHNLRCLSLPGKVISFIPKGIEKLEKLNNLSGFVVADPEEQPEGTYSSLKDLGSLHQLRMLSIFRMMRAQKADISSLANLTHLIELKLNYLPYGKFGVEHNTQVEDVLDELCPPPCLKLLYIEGYFGRRCPKWMQSPSFGACFPSLTTLMILDGYELIQLPPAGELPQLKTLLIECIDSVKCIGPEFLGTAAFPKLEFLDICGMSRVEEWTFGETGEKQALPNVVLLPRLVKLTIFHNSYLKALPKGLERSALKQLYIRNFDSLQAMSNLPNLTKLTLSDNCSLETISSLPALEVLDVRNCDALKLVEKVDALQRLNFTTYSMKELPQWLVKLLRERKPSEGDDFQLEMHLTEEALRRCLKGGPDWSIVESIPSFFANAKKGYRSNQLFIRYTKNPFSYETNLNP